MAKRTKTEQGNGLFSPSQLRQSRVIEDARDPMMRCLDDVRGIDNLVVGQIDTFPHVQAEDKTQRYREFLEASRNVEDAEGMKRLLMDYFPGRFAKGGLQPINTGSYSDIRIKRVYDKVREYAVKRVSRALRQ